VCCGEYMCTSTQLRSGDRGGYYRCKQVGPAHTESKGGGVGSAGRSHMRAAMSVCLVSSLPATSMGVFWLLGEIAGCHPALRCSRGLTSGWHPLSQQNSRDKTGDAVQVHIRSLQQWLIGRVGCANKHLSLPVGM
jgi:hypothetical protein